ncbi:50S ribosomal protein L11 methyltransferase [Alkalihalobacterium chitinilyticum]|uniref:50S ribosomal protein L11 methyltransferase n=1 Tax=Alkalihalobacterium chitinilyticum TaxID=2980103 RepID=A0ABT5V941_9BACI|nr:50S ribosomal protein L11 methyltransferase [Alkalihalobacterium chitinilyticum]MDE5411970.1 50S ribosomal protein L11 methyltransferase [Alkalihalobacterium chitinilyticum]
MMAKELTVNIPSATVDEAIEQLNIKGVFNLYYEQPFETTVDENGYGVELQENQDIKLHIVVEEDIEVNTTLQLVSETLQVAVQEIIQADISLHIEPIQFDDINLPNGWMICYGESVGSKRENTIYLDPQAAFGTGVHETTQDCLQIILNDRLDDMNVFDIGTGSGVLAIASAIKGAVNVTAIDIEPVEREVAHQANLNEISNITVHQVDIIEENYDFPNNIDWTIINIGADETVKVIEQHRLYEKTSKFLISGVVEWNEEKVKTYLGNVGFKVLERIQSNEWVTALYSK